MKNKTKTKLKIIFDGNIMWIICLFFTGYFIIQSLIDAIRIDNIFLLKFPLIGGVMFLILTFLILSTMNNNFINCKLDKLLKLLEDKNEKTKTK